MFKYLGQHIFDFVSQFRNDVYFKNLTGSSDTTALVVDADGKVHTNSLGSSGDTEATKVRLPVRFQEAVVKGDPVYISGYNNGQDRAEVAKADCDDFSKMPSFGLADAAYSANDNGFVISIGNLADVDTQAYSVGDTLYVASGGGLTNVKPTVDAKLIQNVGVVTRSQQNSGQIEVVATGRTNDVPWPLYVDVPNAQVAIGTTTPSANRDLTIKLSDDVNGGLEILRSNGIQKLHLTHSQISNAGSFQTFTFRGDYGANFTQNQNRSSGNIFQFNTNSGRRITDTDAEQAFVKINPDIGQSGTANYVGLLMDVTETSVGSGTNSLMDLRVGGSSKFIVRNDGKVGFRTSEPEALFHLKASDGQVMYLESTDGGAFPEIRLRKSSVEYGSIRYVRNGDLQIGNSDNDGGISLRGDNSSDHLVVTHAGKVGIGTTSPVGILHAYSTSAPVIESPSNAAMIIRRNDNTNYSSLLKYHSGNSEKFVAGLSDAGDFTGSTGEEYIIGTTKTNPLVVLKNDGNVGIGTTSPYATLTVAGNITQTENSHLISTRKIAARDAAGLSLYNDGGQGIDIKDNNNVIVTSGNVGIGTTSPTSLLHLNSSSTTTLTIGSTNSFGRGLKIETNGLDQNLTSDGGTFSIIGKYSTVWEMNTNVIIPQQYFYGGYVNFRKRGTTTNLAQIGLEDNSNTYFNTGNVGIGTTSPSEKLHVSGNAKVDKLIGNNANFDIYAQYTNRGRITLHSSSSSADSTVHTSFLTNGSTRMVINRGGDIGIGTTLPTEKLDVVGNIKASGTIKGKVEQMFACSFSDDLGTTKHFVPFTSNAEQTNVHADQVAMVMPYGGRVKCIQMRLSNIDADTTRTLGIESIAPGVNMFQNAGNWTSEETEAYELVASDDYYLVNYVFSNETHFDSGDLMAISIQDSEDAHTASRQIYINVIVEYDLNNGMGNDTATTKYTS